jgi:hypothetical protein
VNIFDRALYLSWRRSAPSACSHHQFWRDTGSKEDSFQKSRFPAAIVADQDINLSGVPDSDIVETAEIPDRK